VLLRHYVKLFATSIADRIARPNGFSQQAYATVKQKHPRYHNLWDDRGAFYWRVSALLATNRLKP